MLNIAALISESYAFDPHVERTPTLVHILVTPVVSSAPFLSRQVHLDGRAPHVYHGLNPTHQPNSMRQARPHRSGSRSNA